MKRYSYRGFVIVVDAKPVTADDAGESLNEPLWYLARITVTTRLVTGQWEARFDAGAPAGRLFRKASDVYWGGYEAATGIIDEAIRAMGGSLIPLKTDSGVPEVLLRDARPERRTLEA